MFTFSTPKPLMKHKTRISFFSKWWKVIRVSVNVTTDQPSSGVHVASGQRSGERSLLWHPAMKGPDTWMKAAYLWWMPTFQRLWWEELLSRNRKGGRKCVLLMLALWTKVVLVSPIYYSPSFHHSILCLSFHPLFMSPCLAFKGGSQNTQMRKISRFAQTSMKWKTAIGLHQ